MPLRIGSVCSGIGGIELGLERAGLGQVAWQVEIDPWCRAVLERHWPGVQRWDDLRTFPGWAADLFVGGFPCQPYSKAGSQLGADDPRDLLPATLRAIGLVRPRFIILENVERFLHHGLGTLLGGLAALGYDAEWHCIPAAALGAPHLRDRFWLVAYTNGGGHLHGPLGLDAAEGRQPALSLSGGCGETMADPDSEHGRADYAGNGRAPVYAGGEALLRAEPERPVKGRGPVHLAHADSERELQPEGSQSDQWGRAGNRHWWASEPNVGRVAHGVPARVDRLRALGNAVVPQVPEILARGLKRMIENCPACSNLEASK